MRQRSFGILATLVVASAGLLTAGDGANKEKALAASQAHFQANLADYGLAADSTELKVRASRTDEKGLSHVRYDQFYKGVKVFEGEAITHVDTDGSVKVTNSLAGHVDVDVTPQVGQEEAVKAAVGLVAPAGKYEITSELVVLPRGERSDIDRLTWHVRVVVENRRQEAGQWDYFVDAHSGDVAWSFDSLETTASIGTGKTMYIGNQPVSTDSTGGTYYLRDLTRGSGNYTCDMKSKTAGTCSTFTRTNNIFGNNKKDATDRATAGADAHFGLMATWDYYKNMFGRNGIDGAGRKSYSRVHYGSSYQNAFWSNTCFCMTYGDGGSTFYPLVSIDVAGHEMSHGVMSREANLTYSGESGGLNESNSDIFGTLVEFAQNSTVDVGDYWIGERIYRSNWSSDGVTYTQTKALRYMNDPAKDGASPACWSTSLKNLDVHYSSGPNNHMFYLLANGGTSKCNSRTVTGIGRDKAARIWYSAIANYMTASTNYAGARVAALSAASALYGSASPEYNAVAAAYSAINVN